MCRTVPLRASAAIRQPCLEARAPAQSPVCAGRITRTWAVERRASALLARAIAATGNVTHLGGTPAPFHPMVDVFEPQMAERAGRARLNSSASPRHDDHDGSLAGRGGTARQAGAVPHKGKLAHCDCLRDAPGPEPLGWSNGLPPRLGARSFSWPVMSRRASSDAVAEAASAPSTRHGGEGPVCPVGRAATECPGRPARRSLSAHLPACAAIS
jgi:hypothetical protein